ncbi:hypothetical protein C8F04DRAFT_1301508, partial [Mycena alexandri]
KLNKGLLNLPSASSSSIALLQELLHVDYQQHHCFWTESGLHNHLSHHLLSAHNLGAPSSLLQTIFNNEVGMQQPLRKTGHEGLSKHRGTHTFELDHVSYPEYLDFFSLQISTVGVPQVIQQYIFAASANGNGTMMLIRLVSGLMHPFIQLGYGIEFGQDFMVAQGLAQAAVTAPGGMSVFEMPQAMPSLSHPVTSLSLLELLHEAYESPHLVPVMPYDSGALMVQRLRDWMSDPKRAAEIRRIYSKWTINLAGGEEEINNKVRECVVQATLLLASTGKPGRELRADFFLMHYLTGALFLPTVIKSLDNMTVPLLMSYTDFPGPNLPATAHASAFGNPDAAMDSNPWLAIVKNALHHPEPHVPKAICALHYAAQQYGHAGAGDLVTSFDATGAEIHLGLTQLDGTVFARAAGFISNALGWVIAGQEGVDWDRSGLGWEEAWASSD